jgi:cytochrome c5
MSWLRQSLVLMLAFAAGTLTCQWALRASTEPKDRLHATVNAARDEAASAAAFKAIVPVLRHPRCMNCHSSGDFPRQGDDGHRHTMNVRRGLYGEGVAGLQCSTCHQDHNLVGEHMPPGAPGWHLPSAREPMIWEGLSDRQLCELFKNPAANGHRSVDEIVQHMNTPLVLWGWHPGEGRSPIPMPENEFMGKVKEWATR